MGSDLKPLAHCSQTKICIILHVCATIRIERGGTLRVVGVGELFKLELKNLKGRKLFRCDAGTPPLSAYSRLSPPPCLLHAPFLKKTFFGSMSFFWFRREERNSKNQQICHPAYTYSSCWCRVCAGSVPHTPVKLSRARRGARPGGNELANPTKLHFDWA